MVAAGNGLMESEGRDEAGALVAGLAGVLIGLSLGGTRSGRRAEPFRAIGAPTVFATPALARVAGDALGIDRRDGRDQAVLSFVVGAVLALFADEVTRFLPSVGAAKRQGQG